MEDVEGGPWICLYKQYIFLNGDVITQGETQMLFRKA
jgi:hypothetical protein